MIHYIKRKDLDVVKYDACIENSIQSRVYAFSWYLDIVADNWDVLVLDDYEAVMPIPWKQKYFIKYATQPFFCQQLGVFSKAPLVKELQDKMIKRIPKKYLKVSLNFNSDNLNTLKTIEKKNYVLKLNNSYELLFKSFSKGRKHAVKSGEKNALILKECKIVDLIKFIKEFYPFINFSENKFKELASFIIENNKGYVLGVYKEELLLGGGLFLKSKNRIIYLFSSFNSDGRKYQAASFLINSVIKQYENSIYILDFEGGNLPNIGSFFKSFGAETANYFHLEYKNYKYFFR